MSKRSTIPQSRHHVSIFDEDWDWLQRAFGPGSQSELGVGRAIRTVVHSYVKRLRLQEQEAVDKALSNLKSEEPEDVRT